MHAHEHVHVLIADTKCMHIVSFARANAHAHTKVAMCIAQAAPFIHACMHMYGSYIRDSLAILLLRGAPNHIAAFEFTPIRI